uniref:Neuropeptide FF receptor 1 n=1 Tax=Taeniopygia guttata TaxID=59729 RepID=H0YU43_TAEGU|nr:neuropeptide FF receptor 2 [Taeniopygia guttata]XP_030128022.3 neuropeptide FF receptor 2 [Taeniopygia guttata]XP_041571982.1 neuropeptide FF receptor 2 [Taeniopygia guttata]XP_041571983.1 neuropeptide FF receptor 2 [Taeniopygia guttata]XP_041571984.1 neuropeptide FF receptor 2 [Taeniopygia guttata]XP_041571985.1 neuropeptide FF receptor 2 [Taeniopygia guttata]
MDSNSSLIWPHLDLLNYNGTYKYLSLEANVSYVDFYLHQPWVAAVFITSYLLIFLLCMVGNGGVCCIVLWNKRMRTVTNLFILNLAVSDLLVGLFCMPTTLLDNIIAGWPFGSLVCKMSGMVQGISVSASVFTLVAIAVDRFRCIVHPFKQKLTIPAAVATIAVIWVLAVAIMCPSAVLLQVQEEKRFQVLLGSGNATRPVFWCREEWPDPAMRKIYTTILFANIYLAPLLLIVLMYARISVSISHAAVPGAGKRSVWKRKRKAIQMLVLVTLLFALSWLPLWTLMLLSDYASLSDLQLQLINIYLYPLAHWLAFFNSSINPIIYGFCNENFRRGFQAILKIQLCSRVACSQPAPGTAVLPAARCQPAPQAAEERNWVNKQQDLLMEELKEPCDNGME